MPGPPEPVLTRRVDRVPVLVHRDGDALARRAAADAGAVLRDAVAGRGSANAMFATGNSQLAFVAALADLGAVPWDSVTVFHMDEYVGVGADHPAGFERWIRERIVEAVHPARVHYLHGREDPEAESARYAALLHEHPLDLCCLGIGENGHLAFNDPPVADFDDPADVKVVVLDDACRRQQVGEGHFPDLGAVPSRAMTVTIPALLRAHRVLAVVPDERKATAVRAALTGPVSAACPASVLRTRENVELHLDPGSASGLGWTWA
jgi:glucosamine-6-phosphate deaminase